MKTGKNTLFRWLLFLPAFLGAKILSTIVVTLTWGATVDSNIYELLGQLNGHYFYGTWYVILREAFTAAISLTLALQLMANHKNPTTVVLWIYIVASILYSINAILGLIDSRDLDTFLYTIAWIVGNGFAIIGVKKSSYLA